MHGSQGGVARSRAALGAGAVLVVLALTAGPVERAGAAQPPVGLGTAASFAVLGGSTVTNTGPSVVNGDLGVSPGAAVTGFPPGIVNGAVHAADAVAGQAQSDTTTAYNDAAGRTPVVNLPGDIGGMVLTPGVFKASSSLGLTGTVTLDAQGDSSAVFIFEVGSTLTTASASRVVLENGASACNVFWQIGSSATLGTNSTFNGTILALTSISLGTGANVIGRTLARNGAVTMDDNTLTRPTCASSSSGTTPSGTGSGGTGPGGTTTGSTTGGGLPGSGTLGAGTPGGTSRAPTGTAILTTVPRPRAGRCIAPFRAVVTGLRIRRVAFSLDGRHVANRTRSPFAVMVSGPAGAHRLTARVTFTGGLRPATLTFAYRSCAAARGRVSPSPSPSPVPRFTG